MTAVKNKTMSTPTGATRWRGANWFIVGLLVVVAFNLFLRVRLAAMPLERDEGEYAYAGQLIRQGIPPYQLAYNMKFPGAYAAYALLMAICGETAQGIHIGIALVTSLTAVMAGWMGRKLFDSGAGILAAASYTLLAATPAAFGLAGHATHFVAFLSTAGGLALLRADERPALWRWTWAGALFGGAVLMKQHAILIAAAGLLWLGWRQWRIPTGDKAGDKKWKKEDRKGNPSTPHPAPSKCLGAAPHPACSHLLPKAEKDISRSRRRGQNLEPLVGARPQPPTASGSPCP